MNTLTEKEYEVKTKTKRVAIYLRVSTEEQAREGKNGLKVQEERLKQFCLSQDYELSTQHTYCDAGFSGSLNEKDRPALKKLFEDAKNKEFDLVLTYRLDRLFRDQRRLLNALHKLLRYDVSFKSATESFDTGDASGRLMMQILGSFAEHERETIKSRMMAGKLKAARDGKWVTGVPPYGYRVDKKTKKLMLHPEEAEVITKFFEWLVYEKCSLTEVTRRAIELDLPTPAHKNIKGRKSSKCDIRIKGLWHKRTINRFLVNEVYTGTFYYNKYKRPFKYLSAIDNTEHQRPTEEHIEMEVPAIISSDMFQKAIEQLKENRRMQKRNEKRTYLFSGLLYSGYTGHKLQSGYQKPKKDLITPTLGKYYHIYVPPIDRRGNERDEINSHGQCAESRLLPIWDTLVSILKDPANTIPQLEEYTFKNSNEAKTLKKIAELDTQLETNKEQQQRIIKAYTDLGIEQLDYESMMKEKRSRQRELEIQKQKLSQTLLKKKEQRSRNVIISDQFKKFKDKLDLITYEQQQYILRLFVEKITLKHKENFAEVVFKFPVNTSVVNNEKVSTGDGQMRLVLHIKIKTETQRRREILINNPGMYKKKRAIEYSS